MKKLLPILVFALFAAVACDDDDNNVKLNSVVLDFISSKYEGSTVRSSERESNGLIEVEILHDNIVKDVYFDSQNNWVYTSWDVIPANLPSAVKSALESAYAGFVIDDADYVERPAIEYYKVELDKGSQEIEVYLSADGTILDASVGEPGSKPILSDAVRAFIQEKYPAARITEYGYTPNGLLEVEIRDGNLDKEVYFDKEENWVQTDWDVPADRLPDAVLQALAAAYPQYYIDSAEYVERPGGTVYYSVELERGDNTEITVNVTAEGEILK